MNSALLEPHQAVEQPEHPSDVDRKAKPRRRPSSVTVRIAEEHDWLALRSVARQYQRTTLVEMPLFGRKFDAIVTRLNEPVL